MTLSQAPSPGAERVPAARSALRASILILLSSCAPHRLPMETSRSCDCPGTCQPDSAVAAFSQVLADEAILSDFETRIRDLQRRTDDARARIQKLSDSVGMPPQAK